MLLLDPRNARIQYTGCMERICTHCHVVLAPETKADWCPACGGALTERPALEAESPKIAKADVDHRGIVLPRRHAAGGIITPQ
jgi:hypothetical protein